MLKNVKFRRFQSKIVLFFYATLLFASYVTPLQSVKADHQADHPPMFISGNVFLDNDPENSLKDPAEVGFAGVNVSLLDDTLGVTLLSMNTDANGNYAFSGPFAAPNGNVLSISVDTPVGFNLTTNNGNQVLVFDPQTNVATATDVGFAGAPPQQPIGAVVPLAGVVPVTASVHGHVFYDLCVRGNGIDDSANIPANGCAPFNGDLPGPDRPYDFAGQGAVVTLTAQNGDPIPEFPNPISTVNGNYSFDNFTSPQSGIVRVTVKPAAGDFNFLPPSGGPTTTLNKAAGFAFNDVQDFDLTINNSAEAEDVGFSFSTLSGLVFFDGDKNGCFDPNQPLDHALQGIHVRLNGVDFYVTSPEGIFTSSASAGLTTIEVDKQDNIDAGSIPVNNPAKILVTTPNAANGCDAPAYGPAFQQFNIPAGQQFNSGVIGLFWGNNVISGFVYEDKNNDGIQQAGEPGIPGATVTLSENGLNLPVQTGADGSYVFDDIGDGIYIVTESQPVGFIDGKDTPGPDGVVAANDIFSVTVDGGIVAANNNFGEQTNVVPPCGPGGAPCGPGPGGNGDVSSSIAGFVYIEVDNLPGKTAGDLPIQGVTVTITGNGLNVPQITDAAGQYIFGNLVAGTYTVTESQPVNFIDGAEQDGSLGGGDITVNDVISNIVLPQSTVATGYNFGEKAIDPVPCGVGGALPCDPKPGLAKITGFVYNDSINNNGVKDPGDPGIQGVTVTLTGINNFNLLAVTAADGSYAFLNLQPGTYTVTESQPNAFKDGLDQVGSAGGTLGNDVLSDIILAAGVEAANYNFGEIVLGGGGANNAGSSGSSGSSVVITPPAPYVGGGGYGPTQETSDEQPAVEEAASPEVYVGGGGYGGVTFEEPGVLPETGTGDSLAWNMVLGVVILSGLGLQTLFQRKKKHPLEVKQ